MYFLKQSIAGLKRRAFASIFMLLSTSVLLFSITALSFWSFWILNEEKNFQVQRNISILLNTSKEAEVEDIHNSVAKVENVENVRTVPLIEVLEHMEKLGTEFIEDTTAPRILEITLSRFIQSEERKKAIRSISSINGIGYVETGKQFMKTSRKSISWLGYTAAIISVILFLVLIIISVGHFQNIYSNEKKELKLIQSFGGRQHWILLPWITESFFYSIVTVFTCSIGLWYGKTFLSGTFNHFFESIGYEKVTLEPNIFALFALFTFLGAFVAHSTGSLIAFVRSSIA